MFLKKNYSISTKVFNELRLYYNSQNSSPLCNILSQTGLVHILTPYISKINCNTIFLIIKANKMHYFSDLFDKVLYMFRTGPLSIIRSISTLYTRSRYLSCQLCWLSASVVRMTPLADSQQNYNDKYTYLLRVCSVEILLMTNSGPV